MSKETLIESIKALLNSWQDSADHLRGAGLIEEAEEIEDCIADLNDILPPEEEE